MDGGSRPPGLHPQGSAKGGPLTWCLLLRPPGHRDPPPGPGPGPPQGLSPFFQPAAHAISSAIGLASVQPGASRSPSCFPFPGSAWSPRGHKMQDLVLFFAVLDPRETQGHRGV
ncbi:hypothetical protein NDU88_005659 [Pleurodeles waltl]|uniref:Uncharacterized protein n=1 Tax=Pleurodeles waltl TaxID=8319 RepID=A0AAV7WVB5_PLEWA|nr:hypothetical protein NDU88_005659 [Pleurodeles waltl]